MKLNNKHFKLFKDECEKWLKRLELNDYSIFYEFKYLEGRDACNTVTGSIGNATIALSTEIETFDKKSNDYIKILAKHEVLHVLLGRFGSLAHNRYSREDELIDEEEHLVRKLVNII